MTYNIGQRLASGKHIELMYVMYYIFLKVLTPTAKLGALHNDNAHLFI